MSPEPAALAPEVQALCMRCRQAGSPNGRARPSLVAEYRQLAGRVGVVAVEAATGQELQRAATALLRPAQEADRIAAASPRARLRRAGLG